MTRVLVLGNSHVGALRQARDAFVQQHPDIELGYFAVPGAQFLGGQVGADGIFTPAYRTRADRRLAVQINGAATQDLSGWDHVLLVGHRFEFSGMAALVGDRDVLEGARAGGRPLISDALIDRFAAGQIEATLARLAERLGRDRPYVLTIGPYPSEGIVARADGYDYGRIAAGFHAHPDRERLFSRWLAQVEAGVRSLGWQFLHQPSETVAGPWATRAAYAEKPVNGAGEAIRGIDHRHMNADYGLAVLSALVRQLQPAGVPA